MKEKESEQRNREGSAADSSMQMADGVDVSGNNLGDETDPP